MIFALILENASVFLVVPEKRRNKNKSLHFSFHFAHDFSNPKEGWLKKYILLLNSLFAVRKLLSGKKNH